MFKNKNIKTKEIVSNEQPIDTFNAFYNKLTEIVIKIISDNSPIINNEHLLNNLLLQTLIKNLMEEHNYL